MVPGTAAVQRPTPGTRRGAFTLGEAVLVALSGGEGKAWSRGLWQWDPALVAPQVSIEVTNKEH